MTKQIFLGAFEEFTPNFISNAWHHPRGDTSGFATLEYWQDLSRKLEDAGFDFLFLAEALGYPMSGDDVPEVVIREAVQVPVHDPMALVSGLAATVDRLGFVVTASTTAQQPYLNARTFTTLDHLTKGRIAWNIVTSDNQVALTKLLGHDGVTPHDERYRRAAEFVELCLTLWEGAWEDDAVVYDKATRTFADPAKVHRITHRGEYFSYDGYFPAVPSVQRTPLLLQAGASSAGRAFAGRYAECVFIQDRDLDTAAATVADLRARAEANGRDPRDITVIPSVAIIVGETEEEAHRLRAELDATPSREAAAALFMGWSGVDLMSFPLDATLAEVTTEVGQTMLAMFQRPEGSPTVAEILDVITSSIGGMRVTGTAESVADRLQEIVDRTDVDGFLIEYTYGGYETYRDFVEQVMPLLRERGMLPAEPRTGTMRERILGHDVPTLPATHPGSAHRVGTPR
ncbi:FMN-dependent oxidoreductase, nitrilotriacetate monooxygenase family [Rathayibacter oskolensis]|uniref:FMN-dependent oxidoreductase, nitrilotriacetate monooxygenase family n=1 Tax=Rathayibacter oskolensis TaxID=1891671 RepID=A0A1X7PBM2_9MICO|nr:NtaA/DmoA family FMN-dependent monooxygenase [Rathayibacter oskolensis]SMH48594.1 FMN-dependent oxidoreductase, nitrilotriacetate monooxygenase family [Rathayibacter oskolensis]